MNTRLSCKQKLNITVSIQETKMKLVLLQVVEYLNSSKRVEGTLEWMCDYCLNTLEINESVLYNGPFMYIQYMYMYIQSTSQQRPPGEGNLRSLYNKGRDKETMAITERRLL